ncbi:MgtC/SapB family protein [Oceanibaculum indicum]|uniref:Putative transmembrane protein n=1 Tax=Oceanibaculum indicum P24 TaxID=1207063 RepID=K2JTW6_9PROT|nr:DUF4010 domain-containing protein [Oceanibaculum indicum]EKE73834.1 putative transmembrane protein [Oceanibaculum indicum P24]
MDDTILHLAVALGIGLLIGAERERRKGTGPGRAPAGIRTFAIAALAGATAMLVGDGPLLAAASLGVAVLAAAAYWRSREEDPGLTTEVALVLTVLLGGLALQRPALAAGMGVAVAILLAARGAIHRFVSGVLSAQEVNDTLLFAAVTLIVLPILPDRPIGPYGALNPHKLWLLVVLLMAVSGLGHAAIRLVGARAGLPLAGLIGGFASSTATIGAMGGRALRDAALLSPAIAGAVLSSVATIALLAAVLGATSLESLRALLPAILAGGAAALLYGVLFTRRAFTGDKTEAAPPGRIFDPKAIAGFALGLAAIILISAALHDWFGDAGILAAAALAGFADAHAAAIMVASQVASGNLPADEAALPVLLGLTTNTISKAALAWLAGPRGFAAGVLPGLILILAGAWGAAWWAS